MLRWFSALFLAVGIELVEIKEWDFIVYQQSLLIKENLRKS